MESFCLSETDKAVCDKVQSQNFINTKTGRPSKTRIEFSNQDHIRHFDKIDIDKSTGTTSLRYRGEVYWSRNPEPTFWEKVPVGATLCYKCYNLGWRQKKQGGGGRPPDNNNANEPIEVHTEEHEETHTDVILSIDAQLSMFSL